MQIKTNFRLHQRVIGFVSLDEFCNSNNDNNNNNNITNKYD